MYTADCMHTCTACSCQTLCPFTATGGKLDLMRWSTVKGTPVGPNLCPFHTLITASVRKGHKPLSISCSSVHYTDSLMEPQWKKNSGVSKKMWNSPCHNHRKHFFKSERQVHKKKPIKQVKAVKIFEQPKTDVMMSFDNLDVLCENMNAKPSNLQINTKNKGPNYWNF